VAEAPDGSLWQVPFAAAQATKEPVRQRDGMAGAAVEPLKKSTGG
jgi:hypothetical protein